MGKGVLIGVAVLAGLFVAYKVASRPAPAPGPKVADGAPAAAGKGGQQVTKPSPSRDWSQTAAAADKALAGFLGGLFTPKPAPAKGADRIPVGTFA